MDRLVLNIGNILVTKDNSDMQLRERENVRYISIYNVAALFSVFKSAETPWEVQINPSLGEQKYSLLYLNDVMQMTRLDHNVSVSQI